ncbi:uncharacterized protein LOC115243657 [Formica exsecta]|uniref:uncharacterized protein LOC115243657 n=1 Tax=Formica exsecta TaxID=72781 RepID=UPI0011446BAB|nr:uncharacterized protein LOC115243657 [Formica exsecta]XP_029676659.1 uncharacterized protein LOC115243657 [Formica exsecta]
MLRLAGIFLLICLHVTGSPFDDIPTNPNSEESETSNDTDQFKSSNDIIYVVIIIATIIVSGLICCLYCRFCNQNSYGGSIAFSCNEVKCSFDIFKPRRHDRLLNEEQEVSLDLEPQDTSTSL